jgi:hypothetical protein
MTRMEHRNRSPESSWRMRAPILAGAAVLAALLPAEIRAQIDPLLFLKKHKPYVLLAVETANRMQRDVYNDYLDNNVYLRTGAAWEVALGIDDTNTGPIGSGRYRRKYVGLIHRDPSSSSGDRFAATEIQVVGNLDPAYTTFDERTRIALVRRALSEAIRANKDVARFGLFRTRQQNPRYVTPPSSPGEKWAVNEGPVRITGSSVLATLQKATDDNGTTNRWSITRPVVDAVNGSIGGPVGPLVKADDATANDTVLKVLNTPTGAPGSLLPSGRDGANAVDAPIDNMLDDLKYEAERLIAADTQCVNTVAVLVVGGGEGTTTGEDPVAKAASFANISGRRVPIYVVGVAPLSSAERDQLRGIAEKSGGQFTEITAAMFEAAGVGKPIPELVRAVNRAVQHAFTTLSDCKDARSTEHQVTSPIIGTVNLENAKDITGNALPNTVITHPVTGEKIPQRSNVLVTAGFALPGLDGRLRAVRVYKPVVDTTKPIGYRFERDGTKLWVACVPGTPNTPCASVPASARNIYTALPDGTMVPFTAANAAVLKPYLFPAAVYPSATVDQAIALIDFIRSQPLGAIVSSTPAIMDPPSLDPPPDADYVLFAEANKNRRSIVWVGANDGMLHGIDARLGREVWAFIPFNLLPKLYTLQAGQPVGDFRYFVDGSPKVADVKVDGRWRTYLIVGQGAGGTFYQTFDVTLPNIGGVVAPDSDSYLDVLAYFGVATNVPLKWAFPSYAHFDVSLVNDTNGDGRIDRWGDIAASAPAVSKSVGETWSDPAVGQVESVAGRFVVLTGSGFFKHSLQLQANRGGAVAGTTFYMLDVKDGSLLDSRDVGSDKVAETVDDCTTASNGCTEFKNALQSDPVATGPLDSRFVTRTYIGDLDGVIWRFDVGLGTGGKPVIKSQVKLYVVDTSDPGKPKGSGTIATAKGHPLFSSMATVNVGGIQHLFVGTGSDLLPQTGVKYQYALLVIEDQGTQGWRKGIVALEATDGSGGDEKVSAFPAVAGDIVFFTTTTFRQGGCSVPDANLYAMTFVGGPAYDTNNDGRLSTGGKGGSDSQRVTTVAGVRATAPFVADQHLVIGTGSSIQLFGDPQDFNNGVGQAGVRVLSWREAR